MSVGVKKFLEGDGVRIGAKKFDEPESYPDHHGFIVKVDAEQERLLIEFDEGRDEGLQEWWPMSGFENIPENES